MIEEAVLVISFSISILLLLLPFIISAGPDKFFQYTFGFIGYYVQDSASNNYSAAIPAFETVLNQGILMSVVMCFYYALIPAVYLVSFVYFWRREYKPEVFLVSLIGVFLALGTFAPTPGRVFQIALPALVVLVWLLQRFFARSAMLAKVAVFALMIFGIALSLRLQTNWEKTFLQTPTGTLVFLTTPPVERYRWLAENSEKGDYLFEAYEPAVNFPLQLPNPTPITYVWDNGFTPEWQVSWAIEGLERNRPMFIIWDGHWNKEAERRVSGDRLAPLYNYLRENYEMERVFTTYSNREMQAWRRKSAV